VPVEHIETLVIGDDAKPGSPIMSPGVHKASGM
jgi:hypothetical protein